jgi:hypothetical protein
MPTDTDKPAPVEPAASTTPGGAPGRKPSGTTMQIDLNNDFSRYLIMGILGLAIGGGTAGAVGFASSGEVERLRGDLDGLKTTMAADNRDLAKRLDDLRDDLRNDRFSRSDHSDWIRNEFRPWQQRVEADLRDVGRPSGSRAQ